MNFPKRKNTTIDGECEELTEAAGWINTLYSCDGTKEEMKDALMVLTAKYDYLCDSVRHWINEAPILTREPEFTNEEGL